MGRKRKGRLVPVPAAVLLVLTADVSAADKVTGGAVKAAREAYAVIRTVSVPAAAVCLGLAAFLIFTGGERGMEQTRTLLVLICAGVAVVFLAPLLIMLIRDAFGAGSGGIPSGFDPY